MNSWIYIFTYLITLLFLANFLGNYIAKVFLNEKTIFTFIFEPLEKRIYQICAIDPKKEQGWKAYTFNVLIFNFFGFTFLMILTMFQKYLPLNPQHLDNVSWHLAFNTAVSFVTNTNWQSYGGEATMSYLTQMMGLTVQNFLSAATGLAVLIAFLRAFIRQSTELIGNFWTDLVKSVIYILLPLSIIFSFILVQQGVVQTFHQNVQTKGLEGVVQQIPLGPVASQIAIKQLGTNGGGYFNVNSAHPFENPTSLTNFLELLAILLIPAALVFTFGKMLNQPRQGYVIAGVMFFLFIGVLFLSVNYENQKNSFLMTQNHWEGKEIRNGIASSVLWSVATTAASNGSVNAMHSSLSPISGGMAMFNMMLGEIIFGGVGCGLYGMLLVVILSIFLAGLMVGRTPEYLGKKIEIQDMKWTLIGILAPGFMILIATGLSYLLPIGLFSLSHQGVHGFSEMLYAFSSAAGNNGSAFAGLNANTPYYNVMLAISMLVGRFLILIPVLAIAGGMVKKIKVAPSLGTLPTDTVLFGLLLTGVILLVGALTFFPALVLGPVKEHLMMLAAKGV